MHLKSEHDSFHPSRNTYCVQLCKQSNMSEMMRGLNFIHENLCIKCESGVKLNPKMETFDPFFILLTLKIVMQFLKLVLMLVF